VCRDNDLPIYTAKRSLSLADFFQGIIIDDLLLHLLRVVNRTVKKTAPAMVPVTISRAKSQAGFDAFECLAPFSTDLCLVLTGGFEWLLTGEAPENKQPNRQICYQKSLQHLCTFALH